MVQRTEENSPFYIIYDFNDTCKQTAD